MSETEARTRGGVDPDGAAGPGPAVQEKAGSTGSLPAIRRLGLVAQERYRTLEETLRRLERRAGELELELRYDAELLEAAPEGAEPIDLAAEGLDLLVTLGGDGTLLRGARTVAGSGIPVMGINLGHLGFLAAASADEVEAALERLVAGQFLLDPRVTLRARIVHADGTEGERFLALNDFVVHKAGAARVVRLDLSVGEGPYSDEIGSFAGDGVILATPTGSTAYSLAAGGPIIVPTVECMVVTPICPHTLAFRPLVIPAGEQVTVRAKDREEDLALTVDGKVALELAGGDSVLVSRSDVVVPLVRFPGQSYFSTLRRKLNWAIRPAEER